MYWTKGNLWIYWKLGKTIVIPTNAGWKLDGSNVMGRGLAREASTKVADLVFRYGNDCMNLEPFQYYKDVRLILVSTKKLNVKQPWLSWQQDSDKETIINSLCYLNRVAEDIESDKVYVPILGAGNGKLDKNMVKGVMEKYLTHSKFVGVEWEEDREKVW